MWTRSRTSYRTYGNYEAPHNSNHSSYNNLRKTHAATAALAIRIRAEYTMYGGIAVAIGTSLVLFAVRVISDYGMVETYRRFWQNPWANGGPFPVDGERLSKAADVCVLRMTISRPTCQV